MERAGARAWARPPRLDGPRRPAAERGADRAWPACARGRSLRPCARLGRSAGEPLDSRLARRSGLGESFTRAGRAAFRNDQPRPRGGPNRDHEAARLWRGAAAGDAGEEATEEGK